MAPEYLSSECERYKLSPTQKSMLFRWIVKTESGFKNARQLIDANPSIIKGEKYFSVIWAYLCQHWQKAIIPPTREEVFGYLEACSSWWMVTEEDAQAMNDLLDAIFTGTNSFHFKEKLYLEWLKLWAQEALIARVQTRLSSESGTVPARLDVFFSDMAKQAELADTLTEESLAEPFPENDPLLDSPVVRHPTGITTLDAYMHGGQSPGEVYGFCGPPGSCKTMVGIQLAVSAALYYQSAHTDKHTRPPIVYLVLWEGPIDFIKRRILSFCGNIDIRSLEQGYDKLSTCESNLKDYERAWYVSSAAFSGQKRLSEKERLEIAKKRLNVNLRIVNLTGDGKYQASAALMCPGVKSIISRDQQSCGNCGVGLIVLDYAGLAVRKYLAAHGRRMEELRHHLVAWGGSAKAELAEPFSCPVWCLHQLGTEAASRPAGSLPKMTDSAEARNFLENMDFGFYVGVPNKDNLCVVAMVKQRRAGRMPERIWQIDGRFNKVIDVSNSYRRTLSNLIVPVGDIADVYDAEGRMSDREAEESRSAAAIFSLRDDRRR